MKKKSVALAILITAIVLTTCQNPEMGEVQGTLYYRVRIFPAPANGSLRLSENWAASGANITIYVNPNPGYKLKDGSLKVQPEVAGSNPSTVTVRDGKYQVDVTGSNVAVTAEFELKADNTYTVSTDYSIANGFISASPLVGPEGTVVRFTLIPDSGYDLVSGALTVNGTPISETLPYTYTLGREDITVSARFEEKDYASLKASAWKYLDAGEYDTAASFFEEAYAKNKTDPETIMYATLAKLGKLLLDNDVRSVIGSMNLAYVPGNLEDWICDKEWIGSPWYQTWTGNSYPTKANLTPPGYVQVQFETEDAALPRLNTRLSGFVGQFGDYKIAQGTNPDTRQKFNNMIFWILLSKNTSGFNGFIERVGRYVFGDKFEAIAKMAETFPEGQTVRLNGRLKERFALDTFYGPGDTTIGKAELDYIFANLYAIKAAFEYLAVYDWTINLRPWLTSEIQPEDGLDQILNNIFNQGTNNENHKPYWINPPTVATILPLKNSFLTVRYAASMGKAKTDLSKALNMANKSFNTWYGASGNFSETAKANYTWAKDGWAAARAAFDGNGSFYFPKNLPEPGPSAAWPDSASADYGVNTAKFFTPGAFTLDKLFTTELGGKAPSMFKLEWYEDPTDSFAAKFTGNYSMVTGPILDSDGDSNVAGTGNASPRGLYTFELNTAYLKELFPGSRFSRFGDKASLFDVFPTIPLWPERPSYLQGGKSNMSARQMYYYYHWR
jgi:hypothetical protein